MLSFGPLGPLLHNTAALAGSVASGFTPASLTPSIWIEADPAKLYTDAGTTLVSADGQAIQQANDKSTNARNISNATLANRPLYKTGAGHPYILFDGTNDSLEDDGTARSYNDGSGQMWIALTGYTTDVVGNQWAAYIRSAGGAAQLRVYAVGGSVAVYTDSGGAGVVVTAGSETASTQFVLVAQISTGQLATYFNNGSAVTGTLTGALDTTNATFYLGYQPFANSNYWNGAIKGAIAGTGVLTGTDRTNLYNYLAAL